MEKIIILRILLFLCIALVTTALVVTVVRGFFSHRKSTNKPTPDPTPTPDPGPAVPTFQEIKGLGGSGTCFGPRNQFPASRQLTVSSREDCQTACSLDFSCSSFAYNDASKSCTLYPVKGAGADYNTKPSSLWKDSLPFPTYASPYDNCEDPFKRSGCMSDSPATACTLSPGTSCWKKDSPEKSMAYSGATAPYVVNVGPMDDLAAQVVVSNPYLQPYDMLRYKNTFYNWYLDLYNGAQTFVTVCNAYLTLGKWQSDDPTDYNSAIYYAMLAAVKRGVKITWVSLKAVPEYECQQQMLKQFASSPDFAKNFQYIEFDDFNNIGTYGKGGVFFHDKLYISDKKAYIGGQNISGSSSIDFGLSFEYNSPMYPDLVQRKQWFETSGKAEQVFTYTATAPYTAKDGNKYFIALSPTWPACPVIPYHGESYMPQAACPLGTQIGPYRNNSYTEQNPAGDPAGGSPAGNVSYERNHLINLIKNATQFLTITSFDFSTMSSSLSHGGWDKDLEDAFLAAAENPGVTTNIWMNNAPFTDSISNGNGTCEFYRCKQGQEFIAKTQKNGNFTWHWWYPPPKSDYNDCHTLHAKIHYSDWGLLVSSSNLTPDYFNNTSGTGFAAIFSSPKNIPAWISTGVQNTFDLLKNNSKVSGGTCDNPAFNMQTSPDDPACPGGNCVGKCASCQSSQALVCVGDCHV